MGRGLLVFKGQEKKKKKTSKHKNKSVHDDEVLVQTVQGEDAGNNELPPLVTAKTKTTSRASIPQAASTPSVTQCSGLITTSGTVVTGYETKFEREVSAGDALIVEMMEGGQQEMRVVTMRLSNVSLNLSSAFSQNIKTPTKFSVIRKPRDQAKEKQMSSRKEQQNRKAEEEKASGTFGATDAVVYRERTEHGNYRIKRASVEGTGSMTRTDMLTMRSKKTSDKYC